MRYVEAYSHHNGETEWQKRELFEWLTDVFEQPSLEVNKGSSTLIRTHIREQFDQEGWSGEVRIDPNFDLTIFSIKDDLAFQVQTGNISRALYDLMKLQYLFVAKKIEAGALAVPSSIGATRMGSNIANFNRIMNELNLFNRVISVPLLLVSFE
jgi:hypothetical protein